MTAGNCEEVCCTVLDGKCVLIAEAIVPFRRATGNDSWDGCSVRSCCSSGTERELSLAETALCSSTKASMSLSASVCRSTVPLRPLPLESALEGSIFTTRVPLRPLPLEVLRFDTAASTFCVAFLPCPRFMALVGEAGTATCILFCCGGCGCCGGFGCNGGGGAVLS